MIKVAKGKTTFDFGNSKLSNYFKEHLVYLQTYEGEPLPALRPWELEVCEGKISSMELLIHNRHVKVIS